MKKIMLLLVVGVAFAANAISLDVKKSIVKASVDNNTGYSSARSFSNQSSSTYDIVVKKEKYDKGKYVLFAISLAQVSESNGGTKTSRVYVWIPSSLKKIDIEDIGKHVFTYTTPTMKFEKEKWEYIGDYSKGAKLNGVFIGVYDASTPNKKIVKMFKGCGGKVPLNGNEVEKLSDNEKIKSMLNDLGYFNMESCELKKVD